MTRIATSSALLFVLSFAIILAWHVNTAYSQQLNVSSSTTPADWASYNGDVPGPSTMASAAAADTPQIASSSAAVKVLGPSGLTAVAARYSVTEDRLKELLLTDKDLKVSTATNRLLYSCSFGGKPPHGGAAHVYSSSRGADSGMATAAGVVHVRANGQLPSDPDPPPGMWNTLHSRSGSSKTFYLDFTGCQVSIQQAVQAVTCGVYGRWLGSAHDSTCNRYFCQS